MYRYIYIYISWITRALNLSTRKNNSFYLDGKKRGEKKKRRIGNLPSPGDNRRNIDRGTVSTSLSASFDKDSRRDPWGTRSRQRRNADTPAIEQLRFFACARTYPRLMHSATYACTRALLAPLLAAGRGAAIVNCSAYRACTTYGWG